MADTADPMANGIVQPQCQFFVVRKKRLCRMTVREGREYCGEHEPQPQVEGGDEIDPRVPCPNDPKHTCYLSKLDKHLAKCNARQGEDPPYIVQNINAPQSAEVCPRIPLRDIPEETLRRVIDKINTLYDQHVKGSISTFSPGAEHHAAVLEELGAADRAESSRRHLRQASRLLQLAELEGLQGDDTCYVELGAGKGLVSYYIGQSWCSGTGSGVLVVDRAALRHKRDNRLRLRAPALRLRLRADLRHLALHRAPLAAAARRLLGLAKHLCGVATDYALRCLTAEDVVQKTRGALLATCCHHRCELPAYTGAPHLTELGVTGEEMNIMFGIVSWATCGDGRPRAAPAAPTVPAPARAPAADYTIRRISDGGTYELSSPRGQSGVEGREGVGREEVGRRAKALLDYGRVLFLRRRGFEARLCYYVPVTESPENLCIVAKKDVL